MQATTRLIPRWAAVGATVFGLAAGSYGIASAASGNGSTSTSTSTTPAATAPQGWGSQRPDETPLTGDALAKVTAVAKNALPGATIVRVETDADRNAAYEAHVIKADGTLATVYVDDSFKLVSVQTGGPGGRDGPHGFGGSPPPSSSSPSSSASTGAIA